MSAPAVTVIIPTYNWSSVLRHSISTVLWQTFQDFELLVIGDACTDDSEQVVKGFGDARIQWHNLAENSGSQSFPNNRGIEMAKGAFIAYLGHDDVWHPRHLEYLVAAMRTTGTDVAYTLAEIIGPPPVNMRGITGISPSGQYEFNLFVPPSSMMHLKNLTDDIGPWQHYNAIKMPPDVEFLTRALEFGKRFEPVKQLTVFKFPSNMRKNVYQERPCHEQVEYIRRLKTEKDFVERELIDACRGIAAMYPQICVYGIRPSDDSKPGEVVREWRVYRGLDPK
jgi:glycosyltransferase involved in cell wall biosynthesis